MRSLAQQRVPATATLAGAGATAGVLLGAKHRAPYQAAIAATVLCGLGAFAGAWIDSR